MTQPEPNRTSLDSKLQSEADHFYDRMFEAFETALVTNDITDDEAKVNYIRDTFNGQLADEFADWLVGV